MAKTKKSVTVSEKYDALLAGLDAEDKALVEKHGKNFNSFTELENMLSLGNDVAVRREQLASSEDKEEYSNNLVEVISSILGVATSSLYHAAKLCEILGYEYLVQLVADARKENVKITLAHLRELNRLSSQEHAIDRQSIIDRIFSGELLYSRAVGAAVDAILGVERKTVSHNIDDEVVAQPKGKKDGDALDELAGEGDIESLCVQLHDLVESVTKKFEKLGVKITEWRDDVSIETLESMSVDALDAAASSINDFVALVKDIGITLSDTVDTVIASHAEEV